MSWKLKRTAQCAKCPWRVDIDPHDIPNGYCEAKHAALAVLNGREPLRIMACHETDDAHCVGWLAHQLGPGGNLPLRISMTSCENVGKLRLVGEQHQTFEDTLP